jgi:hypothetical protein
MESSVSIARASLWALMAALLALVLAVLPAEYGIDLTGFGRLTGLTGFAGSKAASTADAGKPAAQGSDMPQAPVDADATGAAPALKVWSVAHPERYAQRSYEVALKGDEELEYKAVMARGDSMLYNWRVKEGSQVYFEFHGEPTEGKWPEGYYESYEKGEASAGAGSMVAPFNGHHGWYWLNLSEKPVTVVVEMAGYYSDFSRQGEPPAQ